MATDRLRTTAVHCRTNAKAAVVGAAVVGAAVVEPTVVEPTVVEPTVVGTPNSLWERLPAAIHKPDAAQNPGIPLD